MRLHDGDVWGHFAPMFHLVDAFAIYAMTLLGARHVIAPAFNATDALLTLGRCCCVYQPCTSLRIPCNEMTTTSLVFRPGTAYFSTLAASNLSRLSEMWVFNAGSAQPF
jgi:hypothetical protein